MTAATRHADQVQTNVLSKMWWAILLKAAAIILFALLAFFWLGRSLPGLILLFSIYALTDGIFSIVGALRGGGLAARAGLALSGCAGIAASLVALLPDLTWDAFATIFAAWAAVRGGFELASALTLRRYMERDWSLALIGVLGIMFGAAIILAPPVAPWAFVRLASTYSLITGFLLALLALRFARGLRP
jgi:uncharacterized membrane protein HdeD (DUF308 family)